MFHLQNWPRSLHQLNPALEPIIQASYAIILHMLKSQLKDTEQDTTSCSETASI